MQVPLAWHWPTDLRHAEVTQLESKTEDEVGLRWGALLWRAYSFILGGKRGTWIVKRLQWPRTQPGGCWLKHLAWISLCFIFSKVKWKGKPICAVFPMSCKHISLTNWPNNWLTDWLPDRQTNQPANLNTQPVRLNQPTNQLAKTNKVAN